MITPLTTCQREVFAVATGLSLTPKSQLTTPQADVQLTAADTQLLADHLAHAAMDAAMPPACNFATTGETTYSFLAIALDENLSVPGGDSTLIQRNGHLAWSGHF